MSQDAAIWELTGADGSHWRISGPGSGRQGVTLNPGLEGAFDPPVKTLWITGPFGQNYRGKRYQRREIIFSTQVYDRGVETWHTIDSRWRQAWDYDVESVLSVTTSDGTRSIKLRLLEEPKPYGKKDPHLLHDETVVMTVAAEVPFWEMPAREYIAEIPSSSDEVVTFDIHNDGDIPVFPKWVLTGGALYTLPDFSWGNDMYSRGAQDLGRTIPLPELTEFENVTVDSDPRFQTIIAENESPVQNRWKGNDLLYPIMPGKHEAKYPLRVQNAAAGVEVKLIVPRWFGRPWSRPKALP